MITAVFYILLATTAPDCPMHAEHMKAKAAAVTPDAANGPAVDHRHDSFGFSHAESRHSFKIAKDGGAIELTGADDATVAKIRGHLREIADAFQKNDFATPAFVHDRTPAGVGAMQRLHDAIVYKYEEMPHGARVRMTTKSQEAVDAIHEFLRFQIVEHRTGDPLE